MPKQVNILTPDQIDKMTEISDGVVNALTAVLGKPEEKNLGQYMHFCLSITLGVLDVDGVQKYEGRLGEWSVNLVRKK
jgi:hypothetical protein